jgi:hypothetical protein
MKAKALITLSGLCIASFAGTAMAEEYTSTQNPDGSYTSTSSGYYSSGSSAPAPAPEPRREHKKDRNRFSISVNVADPYAPIVASIGERRPHFREPLLWIRMRTGDPLPENAVVSGGQPYPPATLFVCRAFHHGGLHPGKLYDGRCNISWGGQEISMSRYEILVSNRPLNWLPARYGDIPPRAIDGGYENGHPLFICQANYHGGTHSGKVVGQNCNFGWGGREISLPYYNVLVR